jgi:hypothetical protein
VSPKASSREEWLEDPHCIRCLIGLTKEFDEEWPDDDRALLCVGCMSRVLEKTLAQLEIITRLADEALAG